MAVVMIPSQNTRVAEPQRDFQVVSWQRRADALTRPKLPCLSRFHTMNLSAGCPNRCAYCYAQSYAHHPGWGKVAYYANIQEKLDKELAGKRDAPELVYFSTATEPFLPVPPLLDVLYKVMWTLLESDVSLLISTKGVVPDRFVELLARFPGKVCVQVGITTTDDTIRKTIEPCAASVNERVSNLRRLGDSGVYVEARLDPLIPGLTDTKENFEALLSQLAESGIRRAILSFLFLRWGIKFPNRLSHGKWSAQRMRELYTHTVTNYCGGGSIRLPESSYRSERLSVLKYLAREHGIETVLCQCKNGDLDEAACCHPTELLTTSRQLDISAAFDQEEKFSCRNSPNSTTMPET